MASRQVWRAVRNGKCFVSICQRSSLLTTGHRIQPIHRHTLFRQVAAAKFHTTTSCSNEHIITIQDEEDFNDRVLKNDLPVIVDFHAQ